ncbi:MAG: hypothetical protein U0V70_09505 [Terriglobia bacterium]
MSNRLEIWISILICCVPNTVMAQKVVQKDAQAVSVLTDSMSAMTVPGTTIQDAVLQGTIEMADGTVGTIVFENKGPNNVRREINLPNQQIISVSEQGVGYSVIDGKREPSPLWMTAFDGPDYVPALSRIASFAGSQTKVVYLGQEVVSGSPAFHVRLSADTGTADPLEAQALELMSELHVYIDVKTKLVSRTQSFIFSPETVSNRTAVDTYYANYQQVGGIMVPFRVMRSIMGQKMSDMVITKVNINTGLLDSQFQ